MVCLKNSDSLIILSSIQHIFLIDTGEMEEIEMSIRHCCNLILCLNLFEHFEIMKQKRKKEFSMTCVSPF